MSNYLYFLGKEDAKRIHAEKDDPSVAEGRRREDALHSGLHEGGSDHALCMYTVWH